MKNISGLLHELPSSQPPANAYQVSREYLHTTEAGIRANHRSIKSFLRGPSSTTELLDQDVEGRLYK